MQSLSPDQSAVRRNPSTEKTLAALIAFRPHQERTIEQFLLRFTAEITEMGWRTVFVFSGEPSRDFRAKLDAIGASAHTATFPLDRLGVEKLTAILSPYEPTALLTIYMSTFNWHLVRLYRTLGIHHWIVFDRSSGYPRSRSIVKEFVAKTRGRFYGRYVRRILVVSEYVARRNVERSYLPPEKIRIVRSGVDLNRFQPPTPPVKNDTPIVAFVGQLIAEKGVVTFLHAIRILGDTVPAFRVQIAGTGPLEASLKQFCEVHGLNRVEFLGQIAKVEEIYQSADVVVVPSEWEEAAALVILEAMASGACLVVSDAGGNASLVGPREEGGLIFRRGDPADLASRLRPILEDPDIAPHRGQLARTRAERHFSIDRMVDDVVAEFAIATGSGFGPRQFHH